MKRKGRIRRVLKLWGTGIITGAGDDGPSGVIPYSQAGAGFRLTPL